MVPADHLSAVILAVGTELTEGITQDSHIRFLAAELSALGFTVRRAAQLPDDEERLRAEIGRAAADAGLVVVTGGLGPTADDLTREAVAGLAGVPLAFHPEAWERIRARFAGGAAGGRPIPEANRKQAMAPAGFELLPNPNGTAPGFQGALGTALVVALPGPPREMRPMFGDEVVPLLRRRFALGAPGAVLWGSAFMVSESALEEALQAGREAGVGWGTRVEDDRIAFSIRGGAGAARSAVLASVTARLGATRIREGDVRPAGLVLRALEAAGLSLATAESCTGGLVGKLLTDIAGSSRSYWGGTVVYSNEAKARLLQVPAELVARHGAVSAEVAAAMAEGALARSGAGVALAVTGIAGPDGGSPEKPVGTVWISTCMGGKRPWVGMCRFSGTRDAVRRKSAVAALLAAEAAVRRTGFLDTPFAW